MRRPTAVGKKICHPGDDEIRSASDVGELDETLVMVTLSGEQALDYFSLYRSH